MQGQIFDRWGNMIFSGNTVPFRWDGSNKNKLLNSGVFVYRVEITFVVDGVLQTLLLKGDVTLIR